MTGYGENRIYKLTHAYRGSHIAGVIPDVRDAPNLTLQPQRIEFLQTYHPFPLLH